MAAKFSNIKTYGADPEFLLQDGNKKAVPALGLFGGTKKQGKFLGPAIRYQEDIPKHKWPWYLEDGAALELNIPVTTELYKVFVNCNFYKNEAQKTLLSGKSLHLTYSPELTYDNTYIDLPEAKLMGCDPDYDAYKGGQARKPFFAEMFGNKRFAGCHIHFGMSKWPEALPKYVFVQFLDLFLGIPCHKFDSQLGRREFYGLPGLYRPTSYGVEYRSLSPSILGIVQNWTVDQTAFLTDMASSFSNCVGTAVVNEDYLEMFGNLYQSGDIDWPYIQQQLSKNPPLPVKDLIKLNKMLLHACNSIAIAYRDPTVL